MNLLAEGWRALLAHLWVATWLVLPLILLARGVRRVPARALHLLWCAALFVIAVPSGLWAGVLHWLLPMTPTGATFLLPLTAAPSSMSSHSEWWAIPVTVAWLLGATVALRAVARDLRAARRLADEAAPSSDPVVLRAATELGLDSRRIRMSGAIQSPVTVALLRPVILLPRNGGWTGAEIRAALAHERHHLKRLDPLRLLLARVTAALLFFYPPVRLVLRGLEETNELLADASALAAGNEADSLASALARGLDAQISATACLSAGLGRVTGFATRWDRIRNPRRYDNMTRGAVLLALGLASLVTVGAWSASARSAGARKPQASVIEQLADSPPKVKPESQVYPAYPEAERLAKIEGTVITSGLVGVNGRVTEISMVQEVEGHPAFSEEAKRVFALWRFTPAMKDGRAVAAEVQVPFAFRLH